MRNINPEKRQAAWLTALFQSDSPGIDTLLGAMSPPDPLGFGAYTSARCQRLGSAFTESTAVMAISAVHSAPSLSPEGESRITC